MNGDEPLMSLLFELVEELSEEELEYLTPEVQEAVYRVLEEIDNDLAMSSVERPR